MRINDVIDKKRTSILKSWFNAIVESYPEGAGKYLNNTKNKFSNPIGYTIEHALPPILDAVIRCDVNKAAEKSLDDIIRIRAVQEIEPADALNFINFLRAIIISEISSYINTNSGLNEFLLLEKTFESMTNYAFNSYVKFREKIYEIKANERLKTFEKMIERLNEKYEELTSSN